VKTRAGHATTIMQHRILLLAPTALLPVQPSPGPLLDAHLHYSANDAEHCSPQQILATLDRNGISYAVVTGTPAWYTATLYQQAPERIVKEFAFE